MRRFFKIKHYHFYPFEGEEFDVNDIGTILRNMGIELTDEELSQLMKTLPVDSEYFK